MTSSSSNTSTSNKPFLNALDDIHTRFILNLPTSEISSSDRIFFQIEQAYWFYEDWLAEENPNTLPHFRHLKPFAEEMFKFSPLLKEEKFRMMWDEFSRYKRKISTYGTILLDESCTKVVLCLTWDGKSWSFPAGKVNQGESGLDAGVRETYEETGFDPAGNSGFAKTLKEKGKLTWTEVKQEDALAFTEDGTGKRRTCFVCRGVPEDFPFMPVSRKEVSEVTWHDLSALPKKSFAVFPFVGQLRRWIRQNGGSGKDSAPGNKQKSKQKSGAKGKIRPGDSAVESGLANVGDVDRWPEEKMFQRNEKIIGKKVEYDGNPHTFANEKGAVDDPHRFHVVGGQFLNSSAGEIAPPPKKEMLQKIWNGGDEKEFRPFFTEEGATPWGKVVKEASSPKNKIGRAGSMDVSDMESTTSGIALSNVIQKKGDTNNNKAQKKSSSKQPTDSVPKVKMATQSKTSSAPFLTDEEITSVSQKVKSLSLSSENEKSHLSKSFDWKDLKDWAENLEHPSPTAMFGDFNFDMDVIMNVIDKDIGLKV